MDQQSYFLKIALCGDGAVGKTSLRQRFLGKGFSTSHLMTVGADFASIERTIDGDRSLFQIWDLAGQMAFQNVRKRFYQGCFGGLIVFDLTREETFTNLASWISELWKYSGRGIVPIVLLGNKADLSRKVSDERAKAYAELLTTQMTSQYGFEVPFMTTSAKTGLNVTEAFEAIGKSIISLMKAGRIQMHK